MKTARRGWDRGGRFGRLERFRLGRRRRTSGRAGAPAGLSRRPLSLSGGGSDAGMRAAGGGATARL